MNENLDSFFYITFFHIGYSYIIFYTGFVDLIRFLSLLPYWNKIMALSVSIMFVVSILSDVLVSP
jgi:hypothetical protein